jgi:hypothetical protein
MTRWVAWLMVLGCGVSVALAQQAVPSVKYVPYRNAQFKFATEVPGHWQAEGKDSPTSSALVFSGPKGNEEYYTTINFQIVQRRPQGEDGIEVRARDIQRQWGTAAKYQLVSQEKLQLAGAPAVRMIAQYQGPGSSEMYKQEQFVCEKGQYFYLVSYTAPLDLYAKHYAAMERVIKTFQFLP